MAVAVRAVTRAEGTLAVAVRVAATWAEATLVDVHVHVILTVDDVHPYSLWLH